MRPLLLLGPAHPDPPDPRVAGPDHVAFPAVFHINHLLAREPQARQSILRLAVSCYGRYNLRFLFIYTVAPRIGLAPLNHN